jgi:hypothetical protein
VTDDQAAAFTQGPGPLPQTDPVDAGSGQPDRERQPTPGKSSAGNRSEAGQNSLAEAASLDLDQGSFLQLVADDEEEWQHRQQSLRDSAEDEAEARVGRDWVGRDSTQVSGGGSSYHAGHNMWITAGVTERLPRVHELTPDEIEELRDCLIEPPSQERLSAALGRDSVVFLCGHEGTGRQMAALGSLLTWQRSLPGTSRPGRVGVIHRADSPSLHPGPNLEEACGYLYDAGPERNLASFEADMSLLKSLAVDRFCRIIVLTPAGWTNLPSRSVDHCPPAAIDVYQRWLEYEAAHSHVDVHPLAELKPDIDQELEAEESPRNARSLAWLLVSRLKAGCSIDELRTELPNRRRKDIRARLDQHQPILGRCFLTSAAVLSGLPEARVSDAAISLARHINGAGSTRREERMPAWQNLGIWLKYADAVTRPARQAGAGPTIHLRRNIEGALLRVLWEDQPTVRAPLMIWLQEIAESDLQQARVKAAHAAGVLASLDFDAIMREFVFRWSKSRFIRNNRLAAVVLEKAVGYPDVAPRVHNCLRQLADGSPTQQLTAIHALGSRIGLQAPEMALRVLRRTTFSRYPEIGKAGAGAIGKLYSASTAESILRELSIWVDNDTAIGRQMAALAFLQIAMVEESDSERPALSRLELSNISEVNLVALWRNALLLRVTDHQKRYSRLAVPDSWAALRRWIGCYDGSGASRDFINGIMQSSRDNRPLRDALLVHLWHWRRREWITKETHSMLTTIMKEGREAWS